VIGGTAAKVAMRYAVPGTGQAGRTLGGRLAEPGTGSGSARARGRPRPPCSGPPRATRWRSRRVNADRVLDLGGIWAARAVEMRLPPRAGLFRKVGHGEFNLEVWRAR
jgi:hypothetical protein